MRARSSPGDGLLKNVCEARWSNIRRGDKGHSGPERTLAVVFFGEEIIMKYYGTPGRNYWVDLMKWRRRALRFVRRLLSWMWRDGGLGMKLMRKELSRFCNQFWDFWGENFELFSAFKLDFMIKNSSLRCNMVSKRWKLNLNKIPHSTCLLLLNFPHTRETAWLPTLESQQTCSKLAQSSRLQPVQSTSLSVHWHAFPLLAKKQVLHFNQTEK